MKASEAKEIADKVNGVAELGLILATIKLRAEGGYKDVYQKLNFRQISQLQDLGYGMNGSNHLDEVLISWY